MDQMSDLQRLELLADDSLASDAAAVPAAERFEHILAQLVIELNDERDRIDTLLQMLEQSPVQQQLREHIAAHLAHD